MYQDFYDYFNLLMKFTKEKEYICNYEELELLRNKDNFYNMILAFVTNIFENASIDELRKYDLIMLEKLLKEHIKFDYKNNDYILDMRNCFSHGLFLINDGVIKFYHDHFSGEMECFELAKIVCKIFGPYHKEDALNIYYLTCLYNHSNKVTSRAVKLKNIPDELEYNKLLTTMARYLLIRIKRELDLSKLDCSALNTESIKYDFKYTPKELKFYKERLENQLKDIRAIISDCAINLYDIAQKKDCALKRKQDYYYETIDELQAKEEHYKKRKAFVEYNRVNIQKKLDYIKENDNLYSDNDNLVRLLRNSIVHSYYTINDNNEILMYQKDTETNCDVFNCTMNLDDLNKLLLDISIEIDKVFENVKSRTRTNTEV